MSEKANLAARMRPLLKGIEDHLPAKCDLCGRARPLCPSGICQACHDANSAACYGCQAKPPAPASGPEGERVTLHRPIRSRYWSICPGGSCELKDLGYDHSAFVPLAALDAERRATEEAVHSGDLWMIRAETLERDLTDARAQLDRFARAFPRLVCGLTTDVQEKDRLARLIQDKYRAVEADPCLLLAALEETT